MHLPLLPETELLRHRDALVLLTIVRLRARGEPVTITRLCEETKLARGTLYDVLVWLRECDLVRWESTRANTWTPTVYETSPVRTSTRRQGRRTR